MFAVVVELDGLSRGRRDGQYESYEHAEHVRRGATAAIQFLEQEFEGRRSCLKAMTAQGSEMDTITYRSEKPSDVGVSWLQIPYISFEW